MKNILTVFSIVFLCVFFIACEKSETIVSNYKLIFNSYGGTTINDQILTINDVTKEPLEPIKDGYSFDDWYAQLSDTTPFVFGHKIDKDITLHAKWIENIKSFTVDFDFTGGNLINQQIVLYNELLTRPEDPIKEGSNFLEWTLDGKTFDFSQPITSNIKLIATWEYIFNEDNHKELLTKLSYFNKNLLLKNYDLTMDFKHGENQTTEVFQMRHDDLSLVTIKNKNSNDRHYALSKINENQYTLLQAKYTYNTHAELISFENIRQPINLLISEEINTIESNFGLYKKDQLYIVSLKWKDFNFDELDIMESILGGNFDQNGIDMVNIEEEVNMIFDFTNGLKVSIDFVDYSYEAFYQIGETDYLEDLSNIYQSKTNVMEDAVYPIKENIEVRDQYYEQYEIPHYYLVDLKRGYYSFREYVDNYHFLNKEGEILNLIIDLDFIEDESLKLIYLEEDTVFYLKISNKKSMYEKTNYLLFEPYDYKPNETYQMSEPELILTGVSGGHFTPYIIELQFNYDLYEIVSSKLVRYINVNQYSVGYLDQTTKTFIYKNDLYDNYKILIEEEDVDIKITGRMIESEVVTSEDNPYILTDTLSPKFDFYPGYDKNYISFIVPEDGMYQIVVESPNNYVRGRVNGLDVENGQSAIRSFKKGTYKFYTDSMYAAKFSIKYNYFGNQEIELIVGESVKTDIYLGTKVEFNVNLDEDKAFEINTIDTTIQGLNMFIEFADGNKYLIDFKLITHLYLAKGNYKLVIYQAKETFNLSIDTKVIDTPDHNDYSYTFKSYPFSQINQLNESIFGHFVIVLFDTNNYTFESNLNVYGIENTRFDLLTSSFSNNNYFYQYRYVYISGLNSGSIKFIQKR